MSHWHAHVLNSRAVNRPEKVNCSKYDVNFDQKPSHDDQTINVFKNACFVAYFKENLILIIFHIKTLA